MIYDHDRQRATPRSTSTCPQCGGGLVAKCGRIITWHWAHLSSDCDPWSEPESEWHIGWKSHFEKAGASTEVVMNNHRADVVMPSGHVVELQYNYLSADDIIARENFYGHRMTWIYRCHWSERLHYGKRGFWWKHGSKAMATHMRPVWWDMGDRLIRVRLSTVAQVDEWGLSDATRVLGRVVDQRVVSLAG